MYDNVFFLIPPGIQVGYSSNKQVQKRYDAPHKWDRVLLTVILATPVYLWAQYIFLTII